MDEDAYLGVVIQVGRELWHECGKPRVDYWFAKFLDECEENYTLVVCRCIQIVGQRKGVDWVYEQGLELLCAHFVNALSNWD